MKRISQRPLDGVLLLDKPSGQTSNQALQAVRRLYRARKAGHTGSLDPLATGMLPVCFGQATKLCAYLLNARKRYRVTAKWGTRTDTGDADGRVVATGDRTAVDEASLGEVLARFHGEIEQVPPMYSALKKDGRRLYELARAGETVVREPRRVRIHALDVDTFDPAEPALTVLCSKGTYVRTLVEDIAAALGTVGHVTALRRTTVEPFVEAAMVPLDELARLADDPAALDSHLIAADRAVAAWPEMVLDAEEASGIRHGRPVERSAPIGLIRLYDPEHRFLGVGEALADGRVAPRRLFHAAPG